jgi:hypothetical protein
MAFAFGLSLGKHALEECPALKSKQKAGLEMLL